MLIKRHHMIVPHWDYDILASLYHNMEVNQSQLCHFHIRRCRHSQQQILV